MDDMVWRNTSKHLINQSLIVSELTHANQLSLFACNKRAANLFNIKSSSSFNQFISNITLSISESVINARLFDHLPFKRQLKNLKEYLLARHSKMQQQDLLNKSQKKQVYSAISLKQFFKKIKDFFLSLLKQTKSIDIHLQQQQSHQSINVIQNEFISDNGHGNDNDFLDLLDEQPSQEIDVDYLHCETKIDGIPRAFRISVFKYKGGPSGEKSPLLIMCIDEIKENKSQNLKEQVLESKHFIYNILNFFSTQIKTQMHCLNTHLKFNKSFQTFLQQAQRSPADNNPTSLDQYSADKLNIHENLNQCVVSDFLKDVELSREEQQFQINSEHESPNNKQLMRQSFFPTNNQETSQNITTPVLSRPIQQEQTSANSRNIQPFDRMVLSRVIQQEQTSVNSRNIQPFDRISTQIFHPYVEKQNNENSSTLNTNSKGEQLPQLLKYYSLNAHLSNSNPKKDRNSQLRARNAIQLPFGELKNEKQDEYKKQICVKLISQNQSLIEICHQAKLLALKLLIQVNNYSDCYRIKLQKPLPLKITEFSISQLILNTIYFNSKPILIYSSVHKMIKSDERRLIQVIFNILHYMMKRTEMNVKFIVMDSCDYHSLPDRSRPLVNISPYQNTNQIACNQNEPHHSNIRFNDLHREAHEVNGSCQNSNEDNNNFKEDFDKNHQEGDDLNVNELIQEDQEQSNKEKEKSEMKEICDHFSENYLFDSKGEDFPNILMKTFETNRKQQSLTDQQFTNVYDSLQPSEENRFQSDRQQSQLLQKTEDITNNDQCEQLHHEQPFKPKLGKAKQLTKLIPIHTVSDALASHCQMINQPKEPTIPFEEQLLQPRQLKDQYDLADDETNMNGQTNSNKDKMQDSQTANPQLNVFVNEQQMRDSQTHGHHKINQLPSITEHRKNSIIEDSERDQPPENSSVIVIEIQVEGDTMRFDTASTENEPILMLATNEIVKLLGPNKIHIGPNSIAFQLYTNLEEHDLEPNLFSNSEKFEEILNLKDLMNPNAVRTINRMNRAITVDVHACKTIYTIENKPNNFELVSKQHIINSLSKGLDSPQVNSPRINQFLLTKPSFNPSLRQHASHKVISDSINHQFSMQPSLSQKHKLSMTQPRF